MKILNYIILFAILGSTLLNMACDDLKSNDRTPPTISSITFNRNDTIYFLKDKVQAKKEKKYVVLNNTSKGPSILPDTIVMGSPLTISCLLTDEGDGLSALMVHLGGDTLLDQAVTEAGDKKRIDSVSFVLKTVPTINMFGKKEHTLNKLLLQTVVPDSIVDKDDGKYRKTVQNDEYWYKVYCIDIAGNETFEWAEVKDGTKIRVVSRETILKQHGYTEEAPEK